MQHSSQTSSRLKQQTIAIFGYEDISSIWNLIEAIRGSYTLLLPTTLTELTQLLEHPQKSPDLIIFNLTGHWMSLIDQAPPVVEQARYSHTPVAMVGPDVSDTEELAVFHAGAADYLRSHRSPGILSARISTLLQLKRNHDALDRAARIDELTQIYNRREFKRSLEIEWMRARRVRTPMTLIVIDIDHFKRYNDTYGHLAGDGCLQQVAKALTSCAQRPQDMVCRYGGEEFVVLLPETPISGSEIIAERMREGIESLNLLHKSSDIGVVTISVGIATMIPAPEANPNDLLNRADTALYRAKASGRNQCIHDDQAPDDKAP